MQLLKVPIQYMRALLKDRVSAFVVILTAFTLNLGTMVLIMATYRGKSVDVALGITVGALVTLVGYCYSAQKKLQMQRESNGQNQTSPAGGPPGGGPGGSVVVDQP
jgi:hypothetical protein